MRASSAPCERPGAWTPAVLALSILAAAATSRAQPRPSAGTPATASTKTATPPPSAKPTAGAPSKPGASSKPAQLSPREIEERKARVIRRYEDGRKASNNGEWPKAYDAFREAWDLKQNAQIALGLGRAELETGRFREATVHLRFCIEHSNAAHPDEAAEMALANDWLAEAQKKAAKIVVKVDLLDAHIEVDDQPEGTSPLPAPLLVNPGSHVVRAWLGAKQAQKGILVTEGEVLTIDLVLDPKLPPPPGPFQRWPLNQPLVPAGLGGTFVTAAIGAVLGGLVLAKEREADDCRTTLRPPFAQHCWQAREAERSPLVVASYVGFGLSGALLLATGVSAVLGLRPSASRSATPALVVAPFASSEAGGFVLLGRF